MLRSISSIVVSVVTALLISSCHDSGWPPAQGLDHPLVIIGVDGADWDVIDPLIENGELPNLARLIDTGISGHLINPGPPISPPVWTTFVTGHFARQHGILDHVYPYDDSAEKKPVDSTLRLKPTLWNLASEHGLKSTVVGYFVTWPAEEINGVIVSDRAFREFDGAITPEQAAEDYEDIFIPLRTMEARYEVLERYFPWGYRREQALDEQNPNYLAAKQIVNRVDHLLVNDEATRRAVQQAPISGVDLFITYYRATDVAAHSFWKYYDDTDYEQKPSSDLKEKLGRALPESYRFVDQAIGELMDRFGEQANYLIISDHGSRSAKEKIVETPRHSWELTGNHRLNGVFIASGPDIASGNIEMLTTMDIMPTVTALLGLPLSDELPGSIDYRILRPEFESDHPLRTTPAYQQREHGIEQKGASSSGQESTMEELRGLGYIGSDVRLVRGSERREYSFWEAADELVVTHISGEILYHLIKADPESAFDVLAQLRTHRPELEREVLELTYRRLRLLGEGLPGNPPLLDLINDFSRDYLGGGSESTGP